MQRLLSGLLLSLGIGSTASAVTMDWTFVGDPGNAGDPGYVCNPVGPPPGGGEGQSSGCYGAVPYAYYLATYEVTNAQYAEFLNAKAAADPLSLYDSRMGNEEPFNVGGITRSGSWGSYTYSPIAGRENLPVNYVSFFEALRFTNWLNNGQGNGDTETGAYTLLGGTGIPSNGSTVSRNAGATIVLPNEDEWYKAAYYDPSTTSYFDYPVSSNTQTTCASPGAVPNTANCGHVVGDLTAVGSYTSSASPNGTFDQAGNVFEWNETIVPPWGRNTRAGSYLDDPFDIAASVRGAFGEDERHEIIGFRVANLVPEPGTGLLVIGGLLGLASWRRVRA